MPAARRAGMKLGLLAFVLVIGCTPNGPRDVTGPFTGTVQRFAVDGLTLPADRNSFADDLNGDGKPDNQLGNVEGFLTASNDVNLHAADLIASGVIASFVEITSDDPELYDDPTVSVRFLGADGEPAVAVGGALSGGAFFSNRSRDTRVPGSAIVHLPLWADADPVVATLGAVEIDLAPDGKGFIATIRGVIREAEVVGDAYPPLLQMIAADPHDHVLTFDELDLDGDGMITEQEFADNSITKNVLGPDVEMFDATGSYRPNRSNQSPDALSVGFQVHLVRCPSGECARGAPPDPCHDGVLDGDETALDCGGGCGPCAPGAACRVDGDCQTGGCAAGLCRPPGCSDGVSDGSESDVDCGGSCPLRCLSGQHCFARSDCAPGLTCDGFLSLGSCVTPSS